VSKVRKNDEVVVIVGKDKGKKGKVLSVDPKTSRVIVEKINLVKRHTKMTQKSAGGIIEQEKGLDISKIMVYCKFCKKPSRIGFIEVEGKKMRKCRSCNEVIDKK